MDRDVTPMTFVITNASSRRVFIEFPYFGSDQAKDTGYKVTPSDITSSISLRYSNNSYKQFYSWATVGKARIGKIYAQSSNPNQLSEPIAITKSDVRGSSSTSVKRLIKDPYQKSENIVVMEEDFDFNKNNRLTLGLLGNTTLTLRLYPIMLSADGSSQKTKYIRIPQIIKPIVQ